MRIMRDVMHRQFQHGKTIRLTLTCGHHCLRMSRDSNLRRVACKECERLEREGAQMNRMGQYEI